MNRARALALSALWAAACQTPAERAVRLVLEADQHLAERNLEAAARVYAAALVLQPGLGKARAGQARVQLERGDPLGARALLRGCADPACEDVEATAAAALRAQLADVGVTPAHAALVAGPTPDLADRLAVCNLLQFIGDVASLATRGDATLVVRAASALVESAQGDPTPGDASLALGLEVAQAAATRADAQIARCDDYLKQALLMEIDTRDALLREFGSAGDDDPGSQAARQRMRTFAYHLLRVRLARLDASPGASRLDR